MTDSIFHPPVKRSITIAGHATSISLEPLFWDMLKQAADDRALPVNALVAQIDLHRMGAPRPPGLGTAIRLWLVANSLSGEKAAASQNADSAEPG